jgi:hypothetical protein
VNHGYVPLGTGLNRLGSSPLFLWQPECAKAYASYVDPNATCPVCGAAVFFYQSPAGGRVFFDDLGPPWPKHPCTNNPRAQPPIPRMVQGRSGLEPPRRNTQPAIRPCAWISAGWLPFNVTQTYDGADVAGWFRAFVGQALRPDASQSDIVVRVREPIQLGQWPVFLRVEGGKVVEVATLVEETIGEYESDYNYFADTTRITPRNWRVG